MATYKKYKDLSNNEESRQKQEVKKQELNDEEQITKIESVEHKKWLIENNKVVVVDIYGDWCGPCKVIMPKYKDICSRYSRNGECAVVKEDVDKQISSDVRGVPTFQFFFKGKPQGVIVGGDIAGVERKLVELLNSE